MERGGGVGRGHREREKENGFKAAMVLGDREGLTKDLRTSQLDHDLIFEGAVFRVALGLCSRIVREWGEPGKAGM